MRSLLGLGLAAIVLFHVSAAHAEDPPSEPAARPSESAPRVAEAHAAPTPPAIAPAPVLVPAAPRAYPTSDDSRVLATPSRRDAPSSEEESYGPQTLIVDGLTIGVVAVAAGTRSTAASVGAGVLYGVGAPLVHLSHGRPGMALASFATRATAPVMGGGIGFLFGVAASSNNPESSALAQGMGFALGALTGIAAAIVLDAALYSHVWKKAPPAWDGKPSLAPQASVTPGAASVGVGGTF